MLQKRVIKAMTKIASGGENRSQARVTDFAENDACSSRKAKPDGQ
jgi:hypothetical protein